MLLLTVPSNESFSNEYLPTANPIVTLDIPYSDYGIRFLSQTAPTFGCFLVVSVCWRKIIDKSKQITIIGMTTTVSSNASYRRVGSISSDESNVAQEERNSRSFSDRLTDKIVATLWVVTAALVFRYTKTWHVLFATDSPAIHSLLILVMIGCGINTVLVAYLLLYLPYGKGLTDSSAWEVYCPRIIPTMTFVGVVSLLLLIRAVYPAWGFLSPLIVGLELLGCLFALHFIPTWPQ